MDRKDVERIWVEQKFSLSNRSDRSTAVKVGKILGVDGVVIGTVNEFGTVPRRIGDEQWMRPATKRAFVDADARVVNVATEEIVAVVGGTGRSSRAGRSPLSTDSGIWHGFGDSGVDFGNSDFQRTLLGEAMNGAVTQIADGLAAANGRLTGRKGTN